jgi:hypothetical protein
MSETKATARHIDLSLGMTFLSIEDTNRRGSAPKNRQANLTDFSQVLALAGTKLAIQLTIVLKLSPDPNQAAARNLTFSVLCPLPRGC